jgi:O-antigen/teichoic acid export membrane protein
MKGELAWVMAGHAAAFLGGLLGIKVLTGQLGAAGYGELALGLTVAGTLQAYCYWPLANAAARFHRAYQDRGELPVYFAALTHLHGRLLFCLLPLGILIPAVLLPTSLYRWSGILCFGLLFGILGGIGTTYGSCLNAVRDRLGAALSQGADTWLRIGLGIAAVLLFWRSGAAALSGYCLGTLLVLFWQHRRVRATQAGGGGEAVTLEQVATARAEFVRFALPFAGYAFFTAITLYADRWILQGTGGAQAVGVYAALFQIAASPVNIFFAIVNQLMVPIVYERAGAMTCERGWGEARGLIGRIVLIAGLASAVMIVVTWWLDRMLVLLLTAPEFAAYAHILALLVAGLALWQMGQLLTLVANCLNRPGAYLWIKGIHAAIFCLAGAGLAFRYGVSGMAVAYVASSLLYLAGIWLVNRRLVRVWPAVNRGLDQ